MRKDKGKIIVDVSTEDSNEHFTENEMLLRVD